MNPTREKLELAMKRVFAAREELVAAEAGVEEIFSRLYWKDTDAPASTPIQQHKKDEAILDLLKSAPGRSFSQFEIAERVGATEATTRNYLYRLKKDGLIENIAKDQWQLLQQAPAEEEVIGENDDAS